MGAGILYLYQQTGLATIASPVCFYPGDKVR